MCLIIPLNKSSVISAFWAFLYFVGFCYLANAWGKTIPAPPGTANNMQGAIAFCFFSIFAWVSTTTSVQCVFSY